MLFNADRRADVLPHRAPLRNNMQHLAVTSPSAPPQGRRCCAARVSVRRARHNSAQKAHSSDAADTASRLQLLERLIDVAVRAEDYGKAAGLRDERAAVLNALPLEQQAIQLALAELRTGATPARRAGAVATLSASGDARLARCVAPALHDVDADVASEVESCLWTLWMRSGDEGVDALMQRGMSALRAAPMSGEEALLEALAAFTQASQAMPDFAEAHNKRATVLFILRRYKEALDVCSTVLSLNPYHFGALSGAGMCCLNTGDDDAALQWFTQALAIHPRLDGAKEYIQRKRKGT